MSSTETIAPAALNARDLRLSIRLRTPGGERYLHAPTQQQFADMLGMPVGTIRNWEIERREPQGAARALLAYVSRDPVAFFAIAGHDVRQCAAFKASQNRKTTPEAQLPAGPEVVTVGGPAPHLNG